MLSIMKVKGNIYILKDQDKRGMLKSKILTLQTSTSALVPVLKARVFSALRVYNVSRPHGLNY